MPLRVHGHTPEGDTKGPFRRRLGRNVRRQHADARIFGKPFAVTFAAQFNLAGAGGKGICGLINVQGIVREGYKALGVKIFYGQPRAFKLEVPDRLGAVKNQTVQAEPTGQTTDDLPVGTGVIAGLHGPAAHKKLRFETVFACDDAFSFKIGGHG